MTEYEAHYIMGGALPRMAMPGLPCPSEHTSLLVCAWNSQGAARE